MRRLTISILATMMLGASGLLTGLMAQEPPDLYLDRLLCKYHQQKERVQELYLQYGYTLSVMEQYYGAPLWPTVETFGLDGLIILSLRPEPFPKLEAKFSLPDAVRLTTLLCDFQSWQELKYRLGELVNQDLTTKQRSLFFTLESPLQKMLIQTKEAPLLTLWEKIWEPGQRQLWTQRLLALDETSLEMIAKNPVTLPYLLVTGEDGLQVLQRHGSDFLYFISLLKAREWPAFTRMVLTEDKIFLAAVYLYGISVYHYWNQDAPLMQKLFELFRDEEIPVAAFQKAALFLATNREFITQYRDYSNFFEKLAGAVRRLQNIPVAGSQFSLAERCLVESDWVRLAYEHPDLSAVPLQLFGAYETPLPKLLYQENTRPHIAVVLQAMQHRGHAYMLYRGLMKYAGNNIFQEIIGKLGGRGMLVAINQDPNKYWQELLLEGHDYLHDYEILDNGTIKPRRKSANPLLTLANKVLPVPIPVNVGKLAMRLYQGYYVDSYDCLLAGVDVAKCGVAILEKMMTGQDETTEIMEEWIHMAIKLSKPLLDEGNKYLTRQQEENRLGYSVKLLHKELNTWLETGMATSGLEDQKERMSQISRLAANRQKQELQAEMARLAKALAGLMYSKTIPDSLATYTFDQYRQQQATPGALTLHELGYYMLQNVLDQ